MGEGREEHLNERLDYSYWLGRYPVTNAQFQAFVDAEGYGESRYWPEAQQAGIWKEGRVRAQYDGQWRSQPYDKEGWAERNTTTNGAANPMIMGPLNLPNHPLWA